MVLSSLYYLYVYACTACLAFLASTVNDHSKKAKNAALEVDTQQNLSNLFL